MYVSLMISWVLEVKFDMYLQLHLFSNHLISTIPRYIDTRCMAPFSILCFFGSNTIAGASSRHIVYQRGCQTFLLDRSGQLVK